MTSQRCLSSRLFNIVAILSVVAPATLALAQQFETARTYKAGTNSNQAAVGDFNNDGYQDLAVTNTGSGTNGTVSILLANSNGTFATAVSYALVGKPGGIAVGDFNHDGKQDLAIASDHGPNILLGNGDGTFKPAVNYSPISYMTNVAVGDFNSDGNPDLMLSGQGEICFFAGKSDGTFQSGVELVTGGNTYGPLVAADLNADGKLDLVSVIAGSNPGLVAVFLGNGNGTLQTPVNYEVGTYPQDLVLADFNGDGYLDVAVTECVSYNQCAVDDPISILLGNGNGTFQKAQTFKAATDQSAVSIAAADFNGDGKMDLIVANDYSGDVSELLGNGNGTFKRAQNWSAGQAPHAVVVGDFNHDGVPDVATVNSLGDVTVLLGTKGGNFRAARDFIDNTQPRFVTVGDFNGDGILDLAVANNDAGSMNVMLGQKGGSFGPPATYATPGSQTLQAIVADLNGDGHPDLVVLGNSSTTPISVLLGNGDGTFKPAVTYAAGGYSTGVAVGDFNGDGIPDIAVAYPGSNTHGAISLLIGKGDGTFKPPVTISVGNNYPQLLVAGDVNGDGKLDLVVIDGLEPGYVGTLLGNGDGTFQPVIVGPLAGPYPTIPVLADLNGDGKLDLVVTNYLQPTNNVNVILGNGDGTFQTAVGYTVGQDSVAVAVADFNGDGIPDLAIANAGTDQGTGSAILLIGTGGGAFRAGPVLTAGPGPYSIIAADFNGDGKPDLAVANVGGDNITILLNTTP